MWRRRGRIEYEKSVVREMIALYCRHKLKLQLVPEEYLALADYACQRLDHCKFGDRKPACSKCPVHCYKPAMRERIREVMRWTGPRMIYLSPISLLRHILDK